MSQKILLQKNRLLRIVAILFSFLFCLTQSSLATIQENLPDISPAGPVHRYNTSAITINKHATFSIRHLNSTIGVDPAKIAFVSGWLGTVSYIAAYLLLSLHKIKADRTLYHLLNILGAIGLMVNAAHLSDYPNLFINIIWAVIALMAIFLIWRKRHAP